MANAHLNHKTDIIGGIERITYALLMEYGRCPISEARHLASRIALHATGIAIAEVMPALDRAGENSAVLALREVACDDIRQSQDFLDSDDALEVYCAVSYSEWIDIHADELYEQAKPFLFDPEYEPA